MTSPLPSLRLAAHVTSGFKSRREDLCKGLTSRRRRQPSIVRWPVGGRIQTAARNRMVNAIRRRGWASLPKRVKPSTGTRHVIGAGMLGRATCVTEGDLGGPARSRTLLSEPVCQV